MKTHRGIRTLVVVSVVLMVLGSLCIGVGIAKGGDLRYLHVDKDTVDWWPFNGSFGIQLGDSFDPGRRRSTAIRSAGISRCRKWNRCHLTSVWEMSGLNGERKIKLHSSIFARKK